MLKRLGAREFRRGKVSDAVSLEHFRCQFSSVSAQRLELPWEVLERVVDDLPGELSDVHVDAAEVLGREVSEAEVRVEWGKIRDGAPGEDGVRVSFVRHADLHTQQLVATLVAKLARTEPDSWDPCIKTGLVVPLFKKGDRAVPSNYRGVCLLSLATRLLARVMASRLRVWAEAIGVLGEWQQGFRTGRSTADAAQVFIRMHEELAREFAARGDDTPRPEDPVAILLDLEKAYPRVNRPLMWAILQRLGAPATIVRTLQGLHEETAYRVRGKAGVSEVWIPERGLREGCATSPILFNVFHAVAANHAHRKREAAASRSGQDVRIRWQWRPAHSLPPRCVRRALRSDTTQEFRLTLSLFADDTTICGQGDEVDTGKSVFVEAIGELEERCNAA